MQYNIIPHVWFDTQAKEAAELYTSLVPNSEITQVTTIHDTPSGDTDLVSFTLAGQPFMAISAGPIFTFNRSISFHVALPTEELVDVVWQKLSENGKVLMPLGKYPFSKKFGWLNDGYGLSWQISLGEESTIQQTITPVLTFFSAVCGKAEEAMQFYTSVFKNSHIDSLMRYESDDGKNKAGTIKYGQFTLDGILFGAMDSANENESSFNEAISFIVPCQTQDDIDYFWEKLSADLSAEQCGWLKDKYGVSWQITPTIMNEMMEHGTPEQVTRVTQAFLKMKKFDIATLQEAYNG